MSIRRYGWIVLLTAVLLCAYFLMRDERSFSPLRGQVTSCPPAAGDRCCSDEELIRGEALAYGDACGSTSCFDCADTTTCTEYPLRCAECDPSCDPLGSDGLQDTVDDEICAFDSLSCTCTEEVAQQLPDFCICDTWYGEDESPVCKWVTPLSCQNSLCSFSCEELGTCSSVSSSSAILSSSSSSSFSSSSSSTPPVSSSVASSSTSSSVSSLPSSSSASAQSVSSLGSSSPYSSSSFTSLSSSALSSSFSSLLSASSITSSIVSSSSSSVVAQNSSSSSSFIVSSSSSFSSTYSSFTTSSSISLFASSSSSSFYSSKKYVFPSSSSPFDEWDSLDPSSVSSSIAQQSSSFLVSENISPQISSFAFVPPSQVSSQSISFIPPISPKQDAEFSSSSLVMIAENIPLIPSSSYCGNGVLEFPESCDDGHFNADAPGKCRTDCRLPACGDRIQDPGEQCDDGNQLHTDFCSLSCTFTVTTGGFCGDGVVQPERGEECDGSPACRPLCRLPACGDGILDSFEQCDDGNNVPQDGCSSFCLLDRPLPRSSARPAAQSSVMTPLVSSSSSIAGIVSEKNAGNNGVYTAGNLGGGYTGGNPWDGTVLQASIPPATQTQTGPGLVILIATGAAAGVGYVRRKR